MTTSAEPAEPAVADADTPIAVSTVLDAAPIPALAGPPTARCSSAGPVVEARRVRGLVHAGVMEDGHRALVAVVLGTEAIAFPTTAIARRLAEDIIESAVEADERNAVAARGAN